MGGRWFEIWWIGVAIVLLGPVPPIAVLSYYEVGMNWGLPLLAICVIATTLCGLWIVVRSRAARGGGQQSQGPTPR